MDAGGGVRAEANRTRLVRAWEPGHEWHGRHETPYGTVDDGLAVMANQRGPATPLGVEFAPPHRADRVRALLAEYVLVGLGRRRVVADPDVGNEKAVARFLRQGFVAGPVVVLPEIDLPDVYLPEKRAQLAFLPREVAFPG